MTTNSIGGDQIRAYLERYERLETEKKDIAADQKEILAEAKGNGYDTKILRRILALRKMDADKRREEEEILDLYLSALGDQLSLI